MSCRNIIIRIKILLLVFRIINSDFYVLPFGTIYVKNEKILNKDYYNILFQNELYTNLSVGEPSQSIKSLLKMDSSGFIFGKGAFNLNISSTAEYNNDNDRYLLYPVKDNFYFLSFNSYKEFEDYFSNNSFEKYKENYLSNIIKTNKSLFIIRQYVPGDNKNLYYFGHIGLQLNKYSSVYGAEFVTSFMQSENNINSYSFSFKFTKDNYTYNNFFNNYNKGFFIYGEELKDDNDKNKISYTDAQKCEKIINWCIYFDKIYSLENNSKNNKIIEYSDFIAENLKAQFIINDPYLIGTEEYLNYINETFFNELINKKLCYFNSNETNKRKLHSFICNGKSKKFMNYLDNNFPDLIFEHKGLEENFSLTRYDLFSFNNFNKSDSNMYFLVLFPSTYNSEKLDYWAIGLPFLKKYRLSFNIDTRKIGYYKEEEEISTTIKEGKKVFGRLLIKIIFVILFIFIIFILGMLYQKKLIKLPRKFKANELNDNYEYEPYENMQNKDINRTKNIENLNQVELGFTLNQFNKKLNDK